MKLKGILKKEVNKGPLKFKVIAIIEHDELNNIYSFASYEVQSDGSKNQRSPIGGWAHTIKGCKRAINQDTEWKANDWIWKEIE